MNNKLVKNSDLFDCQNTYLKELFVCEYPWEIISKIKSFIKDFVNNIPEGFTEISEGVYVAMLTVSASISRSW